MITDLGSNNGTYVDDERLTGTRRLQDGDRIELGSTVIVYVDSSLAATKARPIVAPHEITALRRVVLEPSKALTAEGSSRKWWKHFRRPGRRISRTSRRDPRVSISNRAMLRMKEAR